METDWRGLESPCMCCWRAAVILRGSDTGALVGPWRALLRQPAMRLPPTPTPAFLLACWLLLDVDELTLLAEFLALPEPASASGDLVGTTTLSMPASASCTALSAAFRWSSRSGATKGGLVDCSGPRKSRWTDISTLRCYKLALGTALSVGEGAFSP